MSILLSAHFTDLHYFTILHSCQKNLTCWPEHCTVTLWETQGSAMLLCQTLYSEVGSESDICVRNHTVYGNTDLGTQILIWWHTRVILVLRRRRQEDRELRLASVVWWNWGQLGLLETMSQKKNNKPATHTKYTKVVMDIQSNVYINSCLCQ